MASYVAFQLAGVILMDFMSFSNLAFLNAATFLVSFVIMTFLNPHFQRLFHEQPIELPKNVEYSGILFTLSLSFLGYIIFKNIKQSV